MNKKNKCVKILFVILLTIIIFLIPIMFYTLNYCVQSKLQKKYVEETTIQQTQTAISTKINSTKINSTDTLKQINIFLISNKKLDAKTFTENEISHMQDVKKIADMLKITLIITMLLIVIIAVLYKQILKKQTLEELLKKTGITSISIAAAIIVLVTIFFEKTFTIFHKIFFPQGNWAFNEESALIQTFPQGFFQEISIYLFLTIIIISIILISLKDIKLFFQKNNVIKIKKANKNKKIKK